MKKLKKGMLIFCVVLAFFLFSLIPFQANTQIIDSRFGINAFVINRYNWLEWDKPVKEIKDLGASWSREEFIWELIEPEKGNYNWDFYDRAVNTLSVSGVNILGLIDYSAPWATEDPNRLNADKYMPDINEWRKYVGVVVERYKDRVHYWQIWNEPNISVFFKPEPNPSSYLELLKNAYQVIKEKDPSAKVLIAGTSGVDIGYLGELRDMGAGNYFDILAVHPYSFDFVSPPESSFLDNMRNAEKIAADFGGKPIWLTEFGWPTNTNGASEEIQANYLSRIYLLSYPFDGVKKLFWYNLRNDGYDKNYIEHNFGIINKDYNRKKSFLAYQNLIKLLGNKDFKRFYSNGENGVYDYLFFKDGIEIRAIWKTNGEDQIVFSDKIESTKIINIIGEDITPKKIDNSLIVKISNSPIFVVSGGEGSTSNISYISNYDYEYITQSPNLSLKKGEEKEVWIKIKNIGTSDWERDSQNPLFLGTSNIIDRNSSFYKVEEWVGSNRPSKILEPIVKKGETATFSFRIKAHNNINNGFYREYFRPVVEGKEWMKDIGIYWGVEVDNIEKEDDYRNDKNYNYEYIEQSSFPSLNKGQKTTVVLKLKNIGNKNWERGKFNLGTSRRKDRQSIFSYNWNYSNRIFLDQEVVIPGEIGTFSFDIKAPEIGGIYKEYFRPVVDGVGWLTDMGIYWQVSVD